MHMTRARAAIKAPGQMGLLRTLTKANGRKLLSFVLAALAMQALVPAGVMLSPAPAHGAQITLCPQTHPLARAAAEKAADHSAAMAAMHAAMGHGPMGGAGMGDAGMDHAYMGHAAMDAGMVDHAAMGHAPASPEDDAPAASAGSPAQSCPFAGAGALAGLLPEDRPALTALRAEPPAPLLPLQPLRLAEPPRLRPPLRAPPALI
jgi:hypothetical protein